MRTSFSKSLGAVTTLILSVFIFAASAYAQQTDKVIPNKDRTTLLESADKYLSVPWVVDAKTVAQKSNPFGDVGSITAPAVTSPSAESSKPAAPAAPVRFSDEEALQIIARQLNPSGSLIMGERKFLNLEGGRRLQLGDPIRISVRGEDYTAKLEEITPGTYTLSMNGKTLTVNFSQAASSGRIQRTE